MRSRCAVLLSLLIAGIGAVGFAAPAQAADDAYAYWIYYTVKDGEFSFQEDAGPAKHVPEDGDIEAYRYAAAVYPPTQQPRADLSELDFDTLCADEDSGDDEKRVGVLIDYGLDSDAPEGDRVPPPMAACAVVPEGANGMQVLSSVGKTRLDGKNALCGINGYPSAGCFEAAAKASPEDGEPVAFSGAAETDKSEESADDEDSGNALLIGGVVVVVLALGVGGALLNRRRSA